MRSDNGDDVRREEEERQGHAERDEGHVEHELLALESRVKGEELVLSRVCEAVDDEAAEVTRYELQA